MNKNIQDLFYTATDTTDMYDRFVKRKATKELEKSIDKLEESKDNAYWERNELVLFLTKIFPSYLARHPEEDKNWDDDWRWIVFVDAPTGQLSWHIHDNEFKKFSHLPQGKNEWDGHTTTEKYNRLRKYNS